MKKLISGLAALGFVMSGASALAGDDLPDGLEGYQLAGETEKCVSISRIDTTLALDDYNIVFEMRGNKVYLNRLRHRCSGLGFNDSFTYTTSGDHLCKGQIITVLDGVGMGASCSLGKFELLEEVEIEDGEDSDE